MGVVGSSNEARLQHVKNISMLGFSMILRGCAAAGVVFGLVGWASLPDLDLPGFSSRSAPVEVAMRWDHRPEAGEWTRAAFTALETHAAVLPTIVPADIDAWCPGYPDATEAEMVAAAKKAEAHDFILDLQDHRGRTGYDAHLGERGVTLSGGPRQRIALARAILKDAPILVLDEATSALDSEVEASIQDALSRVMDGKTVLAIAHRLSTLPEMDRIVVMDAGRIVEEGPHEVLLAKGGLYAKYWQRQSGGFISTQAAE